MENKQYAQIMTNDEGTITLLLKVMSKYGDNKWWLSNDIKLMCYYQLHEDILLIEFEIFHKGVEALLERAIHTSEFRPISIVSLQIEARNKYLP